jgi:hypothetical protein
MKRVGIVRVGVLGGEDRSRYDHFIGSLELVIGKTSLREEPIKVEILDSDEEARTAARSGGLDALIFVSVSKLPLAKEIAKENRQLRVIVLAGRRPEGEVIILDKGWIGGEILKRVVLS